MAENAAARVNCDAEIDLIFARTRRFVWVMLNRPSSDYGEGCPICTSFRASRVSNRRNCITCYFHITGLGEAVIPQRYLKTAECLVAWSSPALRILEIYRSSSYRASGFFTHLSTHSDDGGFPDIAVPVRDAGENDDLAFLGCLCQNSAHQT